MSYNTFGSRSDRYEKRRKNTKMINGLIILVVILAAFLIGMMIFGGDDEDQNQNGLSNDQIQNEEDNTENNGTNDTETDSESGGQNNEQQESSEGNGNTDEDESANQDSDGNTGSENEGQTSETPEGVKEVINKEWEPYPTEQDEPHIIELEDGSQDRYEMEMAIAGAIDIPRDNLIYWWLESGGVPDRIIGYVEDTSNEEYYRVYLRWITNEGWQPQRVEILNENIGKEKLEARRNNNS